MGETYFRRVARGSTYYFLGAVLAAGTAYLIRLILARTLPLEDFGLFYAVFNMVLLLAVFRTLGMSQAIAKFIPEYLAKKKKSKIKNLLLKATTTQLAFSLIMVVVLWIISDFLATSYFGDERAKWLLRIASFYLPFSIIFLNIKAFFQGFQRRILFALTEPLYKFLILISVVIGLIFGLGIFSPAIAYTLGNILLFIVLYYFIIKTFNFFKEKPSDDSKYYNVLLKFGLPLTITAAGSLLITYFDTLMLTYYSTLEMVGVYNVAYPSAMIFSLFATSVTSVLMPVVSELWVKKDLHRLKTAMTLIYKYVFVAGIPLLMVFFVYAEVFLKLFFGSDFVVGAGAFRILLFGVLFKFLMLANQQYLTGVGLTHKVMYIYIAGSVLNVIANMILIPYFVINGAATASALSFLLMTILSIIFAANTIKIKIPVLPWILILVASTLFLITVYIFTQISPYNVWITGIVGLGVGFVIYLAAIYFLKVLDLEEIIKLIKQAK